MNKPAFARRRRPCADWDTFTPEQKIALLLAECDRLRADRAQWRQMYIDLLAETVTERR